jgi:pre-rRNA-processing protein TSR3
MLPVHVSYLRWLRGRTGTNAGLECLASPFSAGRYNGNGENIDHRPPVFAMPIAYPPTIIVRHPKENPRKCTVLPLKGRLDIILLKHPIAQPPDLRSYVRLAAEGPELSVVDEKCGLLLLDGSWRWADVMNRDFASVPSRSLHGYRTAYPRVSKRGTDPENGLASVEALFIAYRLLHRPAEGLLAHYRWADEFLRLNGLGAEATGA